MADIITLEVDGIPVEWRNDAVSSIDFMEALADANDGDVLAVVKLMRMAFGEEQYANLKLSLSGEDGICQADSIVSFFFKALDAAAAERGNEAKN